MTKFRTALLRVIAQRAVVVTANTQKRAVLILEP